MGSEEALTLSPPILDCGVASDAVAGGPCGDRHVFTESGAAALAAVIDGLGHGPEAAEAAERAVDVLSAWSGEPLVGIVQRCHAALHGTRGAALSAAVVDAADRTITWLGVGNVEGLVLRAVPTAGSRRESLLERPGVVGYQIPKLRASTLPIANGDTLVLATDGIRHGFSEAVAMDDRPQENADRILAGWRRTSDDALVLVAVVVGVREAEP